MPEAKERKNNFGPQRASCKDARKCTVWELTGSLKELKEVHLQPWARA